jgi:AcrR family transcriptional regulator
MSLIWERPVAQRRRNVQLDRERIVAASIALADAEGLGAVTLRRVAAALGVLPMRLYTYLETKSDLLDLMADEVFATVEPPAPQIPWRPALTTIAHGLRGAAVRHPWFVDLLGSRPPYGPHGLRLTERAWSAIYDLCPDAAAAAACTTALIGYVTGALQQQQGALEEAGVTRYLTRAVAEGPFPTLARAFTELPAQDTFALGLDVVLDGIAAQLTGRRRPAGSPRSRTTPRR